MCTNVDYRTSYVHTPNHVASKYENQDEIFNFFITGISLETHPDHGGAGSS